MKTITISEDDLRSLLDDKHHLETQVTELQTKNSEMLADLRELTAAVKKHVHDDEVECKESPAALVKRADLCVKVISLIMTTSRKGNDQLIENLSVELMNLSEEQVGNMYSLLTMEDAFPSYDSGLNQYDLSCKKVAKPTWKEVAVNKSVDEDFPDYSERPHGR